MNKQLVWGVLLPVTIAGAVIMGCVFVMMNTQNALLSRQLTMMNGRWVDGYPSVRDLTEDSIKIEQLERDLFVANIALAAQSLYDVREVFTDPNDPFSVYFIRNTPDSGGSSVIKFVRKDGATQVSFVDLQNGLNFLVEKKLAKGMEWRPLGMMGTKFVFYETGYDDSPGPCVSAWLQYNLLSIDVKEKNPSIKPFILPPDKKAALEKETEKNVADNCGTM